MSSLTDRPARVLRARLYAHVEADRAIPLDLTVALAAEGNDQDALTASNHA